MLYILFIAVAVGHLINPCVVCDEVTYKTKTSPTEMEKYVVLHTRYGSVMGTRVIKDYGVTGEPFNLRYLLRYIFLDI